MDNAVIDCLRGASHVLDATPVAVAYLFGSRAGGTWRPGSDTDIALLCEDGTAPQDRFQLRLRLPEPLPRCAAGHLDVITLEDAPLALRGRVMQRHAVIYSRDEPYPGPLRKRDRAHVPGR